MPDLASTFGARSDTGLRDAKARPGHPRPRRRARPYSTTTSSRRARKSGSAGGHGAHGSAPWRAGWGSCHSSRHAHSACTAEDVPTFHRSAGSPHSLSLTARRTRRCRDACIPLPRGSPCSMRSGRDDFTALLCAARVLGDPTQHSRRPPRSSTEESRAGEHRDRRQCARPRRQARTPRELR